jgi:hypothetical protein
MGHYDEAEKFVKMGEIADILGICGGKEKQGK